MLLSLYWSKKTFPRYWIAALNPKLKLKFKRYLRLFIPSFSNYFAAYTDKVDANEINGLKYKQKKQKTNGVR